MSSVRVGVLSDDRLFAEGLIGIVSAEASYTIVRLDEGVRARGGASCPSVLLLDGRMEEALSTCQQLSGETMVLLLSVRDDDMAVEGLRAGSRGILFKDAKAGEVVRAIDAVQRGEVWGPRRVFVAAWKTSAAASALDGRPAIATGWDRLSGREREVLQLAVAGLANKDVAVRLDICEATVKVHLTHVFQKLGVRTRNELAAAYHGTVPRDERASPLRIAANFEQTAARRFANRRTTPV